MSIPDELRNIRDHLRSGRFGQREVWEQQLEKAATRFERLQTLIRDLLWAMGHDDERILNETTARAKAALEREYEER